VSGAGDIEARRAQLAPGRAVGVTEDLIADVVEAFYGAVRLDVLLGPLFERHVADWDEHLARLRDFWSSVLLMTGRFKGTPMATHVAIDEIEAVHFERWLQLWRATAQAHAPQQAAVLLVAKAENIARSLQLGLAVSRAELDAPPYG
jgi:hemoglobin